MPRPIVADTTIFIRYLRSGAGEDFIQQEIATRRLWLSSVVVGELYAGTRSPDDARSLDNFVRAMTRLDRILTPSLEDWRRAGRLLARRSRQVGVVRPRDHLADVLILVSTAQIQGWVVTLNLGHFETWTVLARGSGMDVTVATPPE
jgi:predicted nucleic acid-binding protein